MHVKIASYLCTFPGSDVFEEFLAKQKKSKCVGDNTTLEGMEGSHLSQCMFDMDPLPLSRRAYVRSSFRSPKARVTPADLGKLVDRLVFRGSNNSAADVHPAYRHRHTSPPSLTRYSCLDDGVGHEKSFAIEIILLTLNNNYMAHGCHLCNAIASCGLYSNCNVTAGGGAQLNF